MSATQVAPRDDGAVVLAMARAVLEGIVTNGAAARHAILFLVEAADVEMAKGWHEIPDLDALEAASAQLEGVLSILELIQNVEDSSDPMALEAVTHLLIEAKSLTDAYAQRLLCEAPVDGSSPHRGVFANAQAKQQQGVPA